LTKVENTNAMVVNGTVHIYECPSPAALTLHKTLFLTYGFKNHL